MKKNVRSRITRRGFLGAATSATAFTIVPRHVLAASGETTSSDKLNIACIGVGGMGFNTLRAVMRENISFLCDVDEKRAANAYDMFPKAKRYSDYRRMLDTEHKSIDAVAVTTPNHTHIPACVMAMKMGKHAFVEKPMGHNIHEVRVATDLAKESGLATQMGSAGHGGDNYHRVVELIRAGTIGEVKEVHIWQDNTWEPLPRVVAPDGNLRAGDQRPQAQPVPKNMQWNLWLGPAPVRPYHSTYHPRHWRGWWDFGGGMLGDMGCHLLDLPFWALDLKYPLTAEAEGTRPVGLEVTPPWLVSRWTFGARGDMPPVELTWYDGNKRPDLPVEVNSPEWGEGIVFVGTEGMILSTFNKHELHPKKKFADLKYPAQTLTRRGYHGAWIEACKSDDPAERTFAGNPSLCSFDYAGPLAEMIVLGTLAYRVGQKLEWDPVNLKTTNSPEANLLIGRENRKGWEL
ncbi:MAG: Gfo/Idh/MocA family oxidoreductase [Candidatus Hydrogenedentes bacterium]|nr:Gfo/Idh/MocA family oxidoreductase [Candidatus Hydrogenedentota bacterium]